MLHEGDKHENVRSIDNRRHFPWKLKQYADTKQLFPRSHSSKQVSVCAKCVSRMEEMLTCSGPAVPPSASADQQPSTSAGNQPREGILTNGKCIIAQMKYQSL